MRKIKNIKIKEWLILIILIGFIIRLLVSWIDVKTLIPKILWDDSFIEYLIAKNIALGNGASFDGVIRTNGFQPLWTAIATLFYLIGIKGDSIVHFMLSLASVIEAGTIYLIYKTGKKIKNRELGLLSALFYSLNPFIYFQTLNGLEVPLITFFTILTIYLFIKMKEGNKKNIFLGTSIGLAMLSRTDALILLASIITLIFLKNNNTFITKVKKATIVTITSFIVYSPWMIWNKINFNSFITQNSSQLLKYKGSYLSINFIQHFIKRIILNTSYLISHLGLSETTKIQAGIGLVILIIIIISIIKTKKRSKELIIPIIFLLTFYSAYMAGGSRRYFTPLVPLLIILFTQSILWLSKITAEKVKTIKEQKIKIITIITIIFLWNINGALSWENHDHHLIKETLNATEWLNQNTEPTTIIGSFDAGVIAYYTRRRVINLDGKVNKYALKATKEGKLWEYIEKENISYIANQGYKNNKNISNRLIGYKNYAEFIKEFDSPTFLERIYILKIKK